MNRNVVLIGLDGVDFNLLRPWIKEDELPNIGKILTEGAWADLRTCPPCWTIPNWNVITTGKNPGSLGVYDFMTHDNNTRTSRPYFTVRNDGNPLWKYIGSDGGKSCIANLPNLHVPSEIEGASLVGWLPANEGELTWPPSLQEEIENLVDGYQLDVKSVDLEEGAVSSDWSDKHEFLEELHAITEERIEVFNYLYERDEWDFFMPVFTGTDRINHALWGEEGELLDYYRRIDEWIGTILQRTTNDSVVGLVSDHGFSGHDKTLYINELLEELDFLKRNSSGQNAKANFASRIVNLGRQHLPDRFKSIIPGLVRSNLTDIAETSFLQSDIDWENTTAYCTSVSGTIFVEADDVLQVKTAIRRALQNKGLPESNFSIYNTSELYNELKGDAPGLIIEFDDVDINTSFRESKEDWMISRQEHGNHQNTGILALHGPEIRNVDAKTASVTDVMPTILYLLRKPIPRDIDGEVRFELLNEKNDELLKSLKTESIPSGRSASDIDETQVKDRLQSLGYL